MIYQKTILSIYTILYYYKWE